MAFRLLTASLHQVITITPQYLYREGRLLLADFDLPCLWKKLSGPQLLLSFVVFLDLWNPGIRIFYSVIPVDVARGVACLMWMASLTLRLYANVSLDQITLPRVKVDGG